MAQNELDITNTQMQSLCNEYSLKKLWVNSAVSGQLPILDEDSMIEEAAGTTITNAHLHLKFIIET